MTAKEYLSQAYRLNMLIESNLRQLEALRATATSIGSGNLNERIQASATGDKIQNIVEKIIMLQEKINNETDKYIDKLSEIRETINQLSNKDERLILMLRYIEFKKWEDISDIVNFEARQIYRIHNTAISNVEEIINNESKKRKNI